MSESIRALFAGSQLDPSWEARLQMLITSFLQDSEVNSPHTPEELIDDYQANLLATEPITLDAYFTALETRIIPDAVRVSHPRFLGHMTSALPGFMSSLARFVAALNQNPVKVETGKSVSLLERQVLATLHQFIFMQPEGVYRKKTRERDSTFGIVTSGGTTANLSALWVARNQALGPKPGFAGIAREGFAAGLKAYGFEGAVIIGSRSMHYSFEKAADIMGLGSDGLQLIATDAHFRVDVEELEAAILRCQAERKLIVAIVGVAGATDSGAVDPLDELAALADRYDIHFHVDAAWAGPLLFSKTHRHKLAGIERAASVTIDGHKQLYVPLGAGMVMFRDSDAARAIEKEAAYVIRPNSYDLGRRSLEGSRAANALFLHAGLQLLGQAGYEFLIDEGIRHTQEMCASIRRHPEFELLHNPDINIVNYRHIPKTLRGNRQAGWSSVELEQLNDWNVRLQKEQRQAGRTFTSRTTLRTCGDDQPQVVLRAVLANPLTTRADIDAVLADQTLIAAEMTA